MGPAQQIDDFAQENAPAKFGPERSQQEEENDSE